MNSLLLMLHVGAGTIAVLAGAVASAVRKGAPVHVASGRVFAVTMALSSALGAVLGLLNPAVFYITFHAGLLGVTLILSSVLSARSRAPKPGGASFAVGVLNVLNFAGLIAAGSFALSQPGGILFGFHAENYFFLAGMAAIAAAGDISVLFRREISDRHRIARHLWRMCLGFFIAAGSAFTGPGAKIFPEAVRQSGVLSLPEAVIMLLMVFWLARTLFWRPKRTYPAG